MTIFKRNRYGDTIKDITPKGAKFRYIKLTNGRGSNAHTRITVTNTDGVCIASISKYSDSENCYARTARYGLSMGSDTLPKIIDLVEAYPHKSAAEEYELAVAEAIEDRRKYKTKEMAEALAEAACGYARGDINTEEASRRLVLIGEKIEKFATDRTDYKYEDNFPAGYPYMPEPPKERTP